MRIRKSGAKALQSKLKELGLLDDIVDGVLGDKSKRACADYLNSMEASGELPDPAANWKAWDQERQVVACFQLIILQDGIEVGPVDGYYGSVTRVGADKFIQRYRNLSVVDFSEIEIVEANPHNFPKEGSSEFYDRFGKVILDGGNKPNCSPVSSRMVNVQCPWKLRFTWDLDSSRSYFRVHREVAPSLKAIVENIWGHYGADGVKEFRLDYFGGDNNCRFKRGTTAKTHKNVSTHAYGIAIDFNDPQNGLNTSTYSENPPSLAHPDLAKFWQFWEAEGWYSLGRHENRDWMHVQAAWR